MPKLTKLYVDKIKPPERTADGKPTQKFYRDSVIAGFGLRITSAGSKAYIVETRINGKSKRKTLGQHGVLTAEQARKAAMKFLGEVAMGQDPITNQQRDALTRVTLQEVFDDYIAVRKSLKAGTIHDYKRVMRETFDDWRTKPIKDITADMVEARHSKRVKSSPARANNAMRVLKALFNHAIHKYEDSKGLPLIALNPVSRLDKIRAWYKIKRRKSYLKPYQLRDWYNAIQEINTTARDLLLLILLTGLRKTEASELTWDMIDFDDRTLSIEDTKNSEPHTLPLSTQLYELLHNRFEERETQWVFPSKFTDGPIVEPRTAIEKVVSITKTKFILHDLRRTFITTAESLDMSEYALKKLLNHKNENDVTAGYIIIDIERLRAPMQKISSFLWAHLTNDPDSKVIPFEKSVS